MPNHIVTYSTPWPHIIYTFAASSACVTFGVVLAIVICVAIVREQPRGPESAQSAAPRPRLARYYFVIAGVVVLWAAMVVSPIRSARAFTLSSDNCVGVHIMKCEYDSTCRFERIVSTTYITDAADIKAMLHDLSQADVDNRTQNYQQGTVYVLHFFPASSPYARPVRITLTPQTQHDPNLSGVELPTGVNLVSPALCDRVATLAGP